MKITICALLVFFSSLLLAQNSDIEFGVGVGAGASKISVPSDAFESNFQFNSKAEVFANYFFTDKWGLAFGLSLNNLKSKTTAEVYQSVIAEGVDPTGNYQVLVYSDDFQELERLTMLELPIGLTFRHAMNDKWSWRASAGVKFGLAVASNYELQQGLCTRLYYPDIMYNEGEAICDIPAWGLYENSTDWENASGDLETTINVAPYLNLGASYKIKEDLSLYSSLYMAYGINDIIRNSEDQLLTASTGTDYSYNSPTTFTEDNNTFEFGLKIGLLFDLKRKKSQKVYHTSLQNIGAIDRASDEISIVHTPLSGSDDAEPVLHPEKTVDSLIHKEDENAADKLLVDKEADEELVIVEQTTLVHDDVTNALPVLQRESDVVVVDDLSSGNAKPALGQGTSPSVEEDPTNMNESSFIIDSYALGTVQLDKTQNDYLHERLHAVGEYKEAYYLAVGHTCSIGSESRNIEVGSMRAENLKTSLVNEGIDESHVLTTSCGESQPEYANDTEAHRTTNRRVEVNMFFETAEYTISDYLISQSQLTDQQMQLLDSVKMQIQTDKSTLILITGHTCDLGSQEVNKRIAYERAQNVKQFFVDNGIEQERIYIFSEGENKPKFENNSEAHRIANRRVEIKILVE